MEEEKPLEWRKVVEILKRKGNEMLAARTAQAAQPSPPSQEAARTSSTAPSPKPHSTAPPSTAPLAEPPQPTSGSAAHPSKKKKKKKKKQAANPEEKHEEPESSEPAGEPVPPPFVFTAGTEGAEEGRGQVPLGGAAAMGTAPSKAEGDKSAGMEESVLPGNAGVIPATAGEGEEAMNASLRETASGRVGSGEIKNSEAAPAEPKQKAKEKKKKGKGGKGVGMEGSAPKAEVGSSLQTPRSEEAGSAEDSTAQVEGAERSCHPSEEAAGSLNLGEVEGGKHLDNGAHEWPPEQPTGWSDAEDVPDFVSDSGESDGEEGEEGKGGAPEQRGREELSGAEEKEGQENKSEWEERSDLWEDEEGGAETRSREERKDDGDDEWGELEEDDVEQLLMLGQLREAAKPAKATPARKKRPPPPAPPKGTAQTPSKPPDTQQHRPAPPPTSFRPRGSPSERIELHLPSGRLIVNRADFAVRSAAARFFVIKSNSVDDVHKSIKYGVWASTPYGNKRLHAAFKEACAVDPPAQVFLLFSVNGSGQFCGVAEMMSDVDFDSSVDVWQEDHLWTGRFKVQWHIIKDVPSREFWHIRVPSNENKPVTNSRDTQDVPYAQGLEMLAIFAAAPSVSSILDYFALYDTRQTLLQEDRDKARLRPPPPGAPLDPWSDRPQLPGPAFRPRGPDFVRPPFPRAPPVPHNIKTRLCQRFSSPGGCGYGDRCLFAHGVHELRPFRAPPPPGRPPFFPDGRPPFFPDGRPAFFPDGRPAFFPPPPFGPGGPHLRPPFWRPDGNGNGMAPGFEGPPPWLGPPPEFVGHAHGHLHQQQIPASRLLDALANGNEGLRHGAAEPGGNDVSGDEKDAQDEYLLQLLTEGGAEKAQSVPGPGQAPGLDDGSEWAGGREHEDEEVCCICFERPMDAALEPCLHALCRQCAELMRSERNSCPVCNAEIQSILPRT